MQQDKVQIMELIGQIYPSNVASNDISKYTSVFTSDIIWCQPDGEDLRSLIDIGKAYITAVSNTRIEGSVEIEEIETYGNRGYATGIFYSTYHPTDGAVSMQASFRVFWLVRKEDNQWKIYRQIWNMKPGPDNEKCKQFFLG